METLGRLPTAFEPDGVCTAGNSSPMSDGAGAVVLMDRETAEKKGLEPLAVFRGFAVTGCDPSIMGIGPVEAIRKVLRKTGLTLEEMDLIELNEAFATQSIACIRELGLDMDKVNVNGGALALGVAALELLLAGLHLLGLARSQVLQPLVVLLQIHLAALAGVHDLPLGHPGHRLLRRRLGGGVLLLGLLPATLAALRALGRHRLPDLLALGGRGGLAGGLWLFGGWFLRRLLLVGVGEDHLDAGDRIVLRQVFKDQRELLICQRLHVVFGSLGVFRQDLRDGLGGKAEILRHLMDSVFLNTQ